MADIYPNIVGPFGGQMTDEGRLVFDAIARRFSEQTEVTLEELSDFLEKELGVERPTLAIVFGGAHEMLTQGLGFESWMQKTTQKTERFGEIPGAPMWRGFRKRVEG